MAAVAYYFQSKDALVWTATQEIGTDINNARSARLDALEAQAGAEPLPPRSILEALILPVLDVSRSQDGGSLYLRNIYTMRTAPYAADNERNFTQHDHVAQRFIDAIQRTFPALNRDQAVWHYEFARGTSLHMLSNLDPISRRFERLLARGRELPETAEPMNKADVDRVIDMILPAFGSA